MFKMNKGILVIINKAVSHLMRTGNKISIINCFCFFKSVIKYQNQRNSNLISSCNFFLPDIKKCTLTKKILHFLQISPSYIPKRDNDIRLNLPERSIKSVNNLSFA